MQTICNYVTLWFRNVASLLSEGDSNGTWQRFIIVSAPQRPEQRGRPVRRAGQRPGRRTTTCTPTRTRTRRAAGARTSARPATRPSPPGRKVIGNVPGNQGTYTEETEIQRDSEGSLPSHVRPPEQGGADADTYPPRPSR